MKTGRIISRWSSLTDGRPRGAGARLAFLAAGVIQFVCLVPFSYAFLREGFTGLAITICCIITLFVAMQMTGRNDWKGKFKAGA